MPIRLTDRPRGARIVFDVLFNAAGSPTQVVQQDPVDTTGESQVFPPSN
jgi:hypothetical protein